MLNVGPCFTMDMLLAFTLVELERFSDLLQILGSDIFPVICLGIQ